MVYKQDEQLTTRTNGSESRLNGSLYKLAKQVTKLVYDTFMLQLTTKKAHARHNHTPTTVTYIGDCTSLAASPSPPGRSRGRAVKRRAVGGFAVRALVTSQAERG